MEVETLVYMYTSLLQLLFYTSDTYTPLASWMGKNGQENIGYKRSVSVILFFVLVIVSLMPLIPYKKIFGRGRL